MNRNGKISELEAQAKNTKHLVDSVTRAYIGYTADELIHNAVEGREPSMIITYDEYRNVLDGAGPKLKELILDRAAHDRNIDLMELKSLVDLAYPEGSD